MANVVGNIPEFTPEETLGKEIEEVKEAPTEEVVAEEKETPTEPPAEKEPAEPEKVSEDIGDEKTALEIANQGLQEERVKLLKEIQELRGQRREFKREELIKVEQKLDELKDLNPEDVSTIDRVLRAKGYITGEESRKMFYEAVKQEELGKFLEKYPEYKPENDSNDLNWNALQRELGFYRMPDNPHLIGEVLLRAHHGIAKAPSDRGVETRKQQAKIAGIGSGGVQRSSSIKSLDSEQREAYRRGGWSEGEIREIEKNLPE